MFSRPQYLPLLAGIWFVPLILGIIVGPWPQWWATFVPAPYPQVLALQDTRYFATDSGCYSVAAEAWRDVLASDHPSSWFAALAREGRSPAARLYGLVGLEAADPGRVRQITRELGPSILSQPLFIWTDSPDRDLRIPDPAYLIDYVSPDSLRRLGSLLAKLTTRAEC